MAIKHYETFNIGRDIPGMGPFRNFNPKLSGPGGSKIKAGIYIGWKVGKFIASRPWAQGTLTGTAIGTGLGLIGETPTNGGNPQALRTNGKQSGGFRRRKTNRAYSSRRSNCHCKCTRCC